MMRSTVLRGTGRVQRAEDDVARFRGGDGRFDRFQIAHFAHEDDVRVLPQGAANRLGEGRHVDADLALVHRTLLVRMVELDRVFDGDDVVVDRVVEVVDRRGQRGRLAGPGRTGHQHQPAGPHDQLLQHRRRAQIVESREACWESAATPFPQSPSA